MVNTYSIIYFNLNIEAFNVNYELSINNVGGIVYIAGVSEYIYISSEYI